MHQSDLVRRRSAVGLWIDSIVQLSPDELFKQQNRLLIRFAASKEQRHEIYANLNVHQMAKRLSAQPVVGGNEIGLSANNPMDIAGASSDLSPVSISVGVGLVEEENLPNVSVTSNHENRENELSCEANTLQDDSSCLGPNAWEVQHSFEYLPEISGAEFASDQSAVTAAELINTVSGPDVAQVTMLNSHIETHESVIIPENYDIPPPAAYQDQQEDQREMVQQHVILPSAAASSEKSGDQQVFDNTHQVRQEEVYDQQQKRDLILQVIAERNTFRHESDHHIAARIANRFNSVVSVTEIENILFAINVSDRMLCDKLYDIIATAMNAETSGHLAIAMVIQELRSRGSL